MHIKTARKQGRHNSVSWCLFGLMGQQSHLSMSINSVCTKVISIKYGNYLKLMTVSLLGFHVFWQIVFWHSKRKLGRHNSIFWGLFVLMSQQSHLFMSMNSVCSKVISIGFVNHSKLISISPLGFQCILACSFSASSIMANRNSILALQEKAR